MSISCLDVLQIYIMDTMIAFRKVVLNECKNIYFLRDENEFSHCEKCVFIITKHLVWYMGEGGWQFTKQYKRNGIL